jgi:hypothetical protein
MTHKCLTAKARAGTPIEGVHDDQLETLWSSTHQRQERELQLHQMVQVRVQKYPDVFVQRVLDDDADPFPPKAEVEVAEIEKVAAEARRPQVLVLAADGRLQPLPNVRTKIRCTNARRSPCGMQMKQQVTHT